MLLDKDQKLLEMLYESIREFVFLNEEKQFFKECSRLIYDQLKLDTKGWFPKSCVISNYISSPAREAAQGLNLTNEEREIFILIFRNWISMHVEKWSELSIVKGVESIVFYKLHRPNDGLNIADAYESVKTVPFSDKKKVIKGLEDMFEYYTEKDINYFKDSSKLTGTHPKVVKYLQWRDEKIKYQNLTKRIPEIEGIF